MVAFKCPLHVMQVLKISATWSSFLPQLGEL
uniref:Uncharacterized protein n=1 Tax=Lotus japonicus TaxID=34305 RepID=I3SJU3_LOTJA|nr:unknown [Lotus japonicus]